ncbi:hypothetical protein BDQ17DRAFT_1366284 [Cyathus striatus]|nr:hypothetical protein BDQ17DRAFT_1366284 [Cyathus striatus]
MPNSYSTISSTASLVTTHQQTSTKDHQAAFGALSSSYGFGGGVPILPSRKPTKPQTTPQSSQPLSSVNASSSNTKDYSAAFGSLASSYGFAGGVPSLPPRKS